MKYLVIILASISIFSCGKKIPIPADEIAEVKIYSLDTADTEEFMPYTSIHSGQSFINEQGAPIHTYLKSKSLNEDEMDDLINSLYEETGPVTATSCDPIYRDVVVFYDRKSKPVSRIEICFECGQAYFHPGEQYALTSGSYESLRSFFDEIDLIRPGKF